MKWLKKLFGIRPMMRLAKLGILEDEEGVKAFEMNDYEKVETLRRFCHSKETGDYSEVDWPVDIKFHMVVYRIGQILDERGGIEEMRKFVDEVGSVAGIHHLEMRWDGIGEWQSMLPASEIGERKLNPNVVGETLRAKISLGAESMETQFDDGDHLQCRGRHRCISSTMTTRM